MTNVSCFFSEFFATSLLLLVVLAITDRENGPPPPGLNPLVLFVTVLGIGVSLGMEVSSTNLRGREHAIDSYLLDWIRDQSS
jgi:glycerol uptake facilitator-like aquaporin